MFYLARTIQYQPHLVKNSLLIIQNCWEAGKRFVPLTHFFVTFCVDFANLSREKMMLGKKKYQPTLLLTMFKYWMIL